MKKISFFGEKVIECVTFTWSKQQTISNVEKVGQPLSLCCGGGRGTVVGGWGGTMHYQVRSPLPALSLSISEIRKRDPAAVLSLVDPFEIQSNKRNDIPFPMLRRTQILLVS